MEGFVAAREEVDKRLQACQHSYRKRLGSHRVSEFPGKANDRTHFRWTVWCVSLDVRQPLLDESIRRSGLSLSHPYVEVVGRACYAIGECRNSAVRLRVLRGQHQAVCRRALQKEKR